MKPEPLKNKLMWLVPQKSGFLKEDIKSAVEWFRRKSCYNWRVKGHHCPRCVLLDKAFEDVK